MYLSEFRMYTRTSKSRLKIMGVHGVLSERRSDGTIDTKVIFDGGAPPIDICGTKVVENAVYNHLTAINTLENSVDNIQTVSEQVMTILYDVEFRNQE